jgi:cell division protein FtsI/penicillin-binding protein 2
LFVILVLRLVEIQIIRHRFYQQKTLEQRTRLIELAAQRGDIFDRNGNILATSIDTYSLFKHNKGWLARKLSLAAAKKKQAQDPENISLLKEKKRIYPKKGLAAQTIGFVGVDNQGLAGIELALDEYLKGRKGRVVTEGDPRGRELYGTLRELERGEDGMNVTLTIDENVQYVAEKELTRQIRRFGAIAGMCIVMDCKTGEILALASEPAFDPNYYQRAQRKRWHPRVVDPYEPGSTFKVITVAAGLEEGVIDLDTRIKSMDSINVGGKVITNSHPIDWPGRTISLSKMLEESINTGAAQIGIKLGRENFYERIRDFGFGERTGFGLWGESKGIVHPWRKWYKPDVGMVSFGQGIAVTPLQLLSAFSAFTNNGIVVSPVLIKRIESNDGRFLKVFTAKKQRAISPRTAELTKKMMSNVVALGTGKRAQIDGFRVCGKTGTAQKARLGGVGYLKDQYISSFIGFAPFNEPEVITLVIIDGAKDTYWGGTVCGPVFKHVTEYALRYLNAKPDVI